MAHPGNQVVIVDDDVQVAKAIARLLTAAGFHARTFSSGESMLQAPGIEASCFIFDIHMPAMSGIELARRVRTAGIHTPIVFITAHDEPHLRADAERLGALGFMTKPVECESLLAVLSRASA